VYVHCLPYVSECGCKVLFGDAGYPSPFPTAAVLATLPTPWTARIDMSLVMPVQYQDADLNWHTYGSFIGVYDPNGSYGAGTGYVVRGKTFNISNTATLSTYSLMKSDPRSDRFGPGFYVYQSGANNVGALSASTGTINNPANLLAPFIAVLGSVLLLPYRMDMWAAYNSSVPVPTPS